MQHGDGVPDRHCLAGRRYRDTQLVLDVITSGEGPSPETLKVNSPEASSLVGICSPVFTTGYRWKSRAAAQECACRALYVRTSSCQRSAACADLAWQGVHRVGTRRQTGRRRWSCTSAIQVKWRHLLSDPDPSQTLRTVQCQVRHGSFTQVGDLHS